MLNNPDSSKIKDQLQDISKVYPRIKSLDLRNCFQFSVESLQIIASQWFKFLTSLNLEYSTLSDANLAALFETEKLCATKDVESLPLRKINLAHTYISDKGVSHLVKRCPNLSSINMKGCCNITNVSLSLIAKHCKNLSVFYAPECNISDYGIQILAQECKANLTVVDLNDCSAITDQVFHYLCYFCPNLKRIRVRGTKVTTVGLSVALKQFALIELNIHGLLIDECLVLQIAKDQKILEILDLSFCHNITSSSVSAIIQCCQLLREIHIFGTNLVLQEELVSYASTRLTILW